MSKLQISFGSVSSIQDKRTITSDMLPRDMAGEIPYSAKVPLDYPSVNDLCNQRKLGICTQCSARMVVEEGFKDGVRLSEYWGYLIQKTMFDDIDYGYHFEGSSIFTALKAAKTYGIPEQSIESKYPLKTDGTYAEFMDNFRKVYGGKIPSEIIKNAEKHKIPGYYAVRVDPNAIAREIASGKVLAVRLTVGENTYRARDGRVSWSEADLLPLRAPTKVEGGHAMAANEYKGLDDNQLITGPNSWSKAWGKDGYYYFVFKDQKGFFTEAWAIGEIPQRIIEEVKKDEFKVDLRPGMNHPDVKRLQQYLNSKGFTVSDIGPGSKGNETTTYGQKTREAVQRFQLKYNIVKPGMPGYGHFGPRTRSVANRV